jgi:hypothetical protein
MVNKKYLENKIEDKEITINALVARYFASKKVATDYLIEHAPLEIKFNRLEFLSEQIENSKNELKNLQKILLEIKEQYSMLLEFQLDLKEINENEFSAKRRNIHE